MKEHIVYEYEESDFADIRREMTLEKAIDIVSWLKRAGSHTGSRHGRKM